MNRLPGITDGPLVAELQLTSGSEPAARVHDCWNTIGVSGNGSCRELPRYVHCRNCPVYSAAALELLERPATEEYRREWSAHFAREKNIATPARMSVVIFRVALEWLALTTHAFQEVAERRAIHTLPHRRHSVVLGLVNIRGELLICASLTRLLGMGVETARDRSRTNHDRLLVTHWEGQRVVFPVDEVHGIQRVRKDELREPPATVAKSTKTHSRGVFAWRDHTVGLLAAELLFPALNRNLG